MNKRIPLIYLLFFVLVFALFLAFLFFSLKKPKHYKEPIISKIEGAVRGNIKTKEFILAKSEKTYNVYIRPMFIEPTKRSFFIDLFSIYTGVDKNTLRQKLLLPPKRRVLLATVNLRTKQQLIHLRKILDKYRVFITYHNVRRGYDIESIEKTKNGYKALFYRVYPYKDTFEPFLGRYSKETLKGDNGTEEYYEELLRPKRNGIFRGYRDVGGNIIYDKKAKIIYPQNGEDIVLNINLILQKRIEKLLDKAKKDYNASEVMAAVMDSKTGKIIAIATSNRFNPEHIRKEDIPNMSIHAIRYAFEPGSVMKPIIFAMLLDKGRVNPYEILKAYNGSWKPKWRKTPIIDDEPKDWLSAENALVYSSNIVLSQLALRLDAYEIYNGLKVFGFSRLSGIDLPHELRGSIRTLREYHYPIYKSTTAYGYGIGVTFIQLLKAYNVFNNNGYIVTPRIVSYDEKREKIISSQTANEMLRILRKIVLKGTAKVAYIPDIFTAGKTGTAHVSKNKEYQQIYNSSFFGFANDNFHKYTIGVTFFNIKAPSPMYYAAKSAVPLFKKIVFIMKDEKLIGEDHGN
jgi:cell division protein FtsI (penicillin-binding protein 3)